MTLRHWSIAALAMTALACGGADGPATRAADSTATASAPDTSSGASGMAGMNNVMASTAMMERMEAHLRASEGAGQDTLEAALPEHRQSVADLIAQVNREMRDMGMAGDAAWNATVDSLRQDLVRLPELGRDEVESMMPAHRARVMRLIEMHRRMLASM